MIELADPRMLWMLLGLAPYGYWRWRRTCSTAVPFAPLQYHCSSLLRRSLLPTGIALEVALLAVVIIGLAGPHRVDEIESVTSEGLDVVLVLDVSASMQAADFPPNRLEALKQVASDFLYRGGGNRVGILAFAGHTFTQSPMTTDHTVLAEMVDSLSFKSISHARSGGTAIGDALLVATDTLLAGRLAGRDQVILLISDGESNLGIDPELAARHLRENDIRLHVIGIGGDEPVEVHVDGQPFINQEDQVLVTSLDDTQLIAIAEIAGGSYYRARSHDLLAEIFDQLSRLESTPLEVRRLRLQRSLVPAIALVLSLLFAAWLWLNGVVLRRPLR
jgi:Ca-activated chloride channel family protein